MSDKIEIKIGTATCGNAAGAQKTLAKILELTKGNGTPLECLVHGFGI